jgi:hypothetical protein
MKSSTKYAGTGIGKAGKDDRQLRKYGVAQAAHGVRADHDYDAPRSRSSGSC